MSNAKNNIFVQLYKPIDPQQSPQSPQGSAPISPESDPFSGGLPSEYTPIVEYVEPQIDEALTQHVQNANPQFIPQPTIPLTPTQTPPVPGIQPMQFPPLPLSDAEVEKELKTDVYNAIRWLAEWCIRQLQIYKQSS
jgi:hypothetical protein